MTDRLEPSRQVQERWLQAIGRFGLDHLDALETAPAFTGSRPPILAEPRPRRKALGDEDGWSQGDATA